ncbi:ABC transporter substrate-binding protein [Stomatohabitans albus]|uniref:ABC transporter substrate-binding protein n=1 Tax=Stomatohabitans albus TaxID=3110766 RepID=UPI00300D98A0
MLRLRAVAPVLSFALLAAGCSSTPSAPSSDSGSSQPSAAGHSDSIAQASDGASMASCTPADMQTIEAGTLTVATGEVVFEPWMKDDTPENGEGFESALVYAVAERLGYQKDHVKWVRTGFDEAIKPGEKNWDVNIQQYSITDERKQVVDFSAPYYKVQQAVVAAKDASIKEAKTIGALKSAKLGAHIGSTSLHYIDDEIKPDAPAQAYDDNVAAKSAIDAGQVDGVVFDLPTAFYVTAVEMPDTTIVGILPEAEDGEAMGMLLPKGSPIKGCLDQAIESLDAAGELKSLQDKWLTAGGDIATLER